MNIRLNSIKLFAYHGVYPEEIANGNHFEIDVEVELSDPPGLHSDDVSETLDYSLLYQVVLSVSQNRRYNLIEAFAYDICTVVFDTFPDIKSIRTRIRKLKALVGGEIGNVEAEILRNRSIAE